MFLTGPPGVGAGLRLRRVAHRRHDGSSALAGNPALRTYFADLAATRGLPLREEALGAGQSYAELARPVVEAVTTPDEPVDLLVLAYGVHDVQPGRNIAPHLAGGCPGDPLAFAVCDQGPAAAFTALRLIADHGATGACRRAVLVVAEQSVVPYPLAAPAPLPARHAAVALLFEAGPSAVTVRQRQGLAPEAVSAALAEDLADLTGGRHDVTLVIGAGVEPPAVPVARVLRAAPGQPYTGLWARLGDLGDSDFGDSDLGDNDFGDLEPARPLLLADHDPMLGVLCVAALEPDHRPLAHHAAAGPSERGGGVADMAVKD